MNTKTQLLSIILVITFTSGVCANTSPMIAESTLSALVDEKIIDGFDLDLCPAFERTVLSESELTILSQRFKEFPWEWIIVSPYDAHVSLDEQLQVEVIMFSVLLLLDSLGEYTKFIKALHVKPKTTDPAKDVLEVQLVGSEQVVACAEWKRGESRQITSVAIPQDLLLQISALLGIGDTLLLKNMSIQDLYKIVELEIRAQGGIRHCVNRFMKKGKFELLDPVAYGKKILERQIFFRQLKEYSIDPDPNERFRILVKIQELRAYIRTIEQDDLSYRDIQSLYVYIVHNKIVPFFDSDDITDEGEVASFRALQEDPSSQYKRVMNVLDARRPQQLLDEIISAIYDDLDRYRRDIMVDPEEDFNEKNVYALTWLKELSVIYFERILMERLLDESGNYQAEGSEFIVGQEQLISNIERTVYQIILQGNDSDKKIFLHIVLKDDVCELIVVNDNYKQVMKRKIYYVEDTVLFYKAAVTAFQHDLSAVMQTIFKKEIPKIEEDVSIVVKYPDNRSMVLRGMIEPAYLLKDHTIIMYNTMQDVSLSAVFFGLQWSEPSYDDTFLYLGTQENVKLPEVSEACATSPENFALHLRQLDPAQLPAVRILYGNGTVIEGNLEWNGDQLVVRYLGMRVLPPQGGVEEVRLLDRIPDQVSEFEARVLREA